MISELLQEEESKFKLNILYLGAPYCHKSMQGSGQDTHTTNKNICHVPRGPCNTQLYVPIACSSLWWISGITEMLPICQSRVHSSPGLHNHSTHQALAYSTNPCSLGTFCTKTSKKIRTKMHQFLQSPVSQKGPLYQAPMPWFRE